MLNDIIILAWYYQPNIIFSREILKLQITQIHITIVSNQLIDIIKNISGLSWWYHDIFQRNSKSSHTDSIKPTDWYYHDINIIIKSGYYQDISVKNIIRISAISITRQWKSIDMVLCDSTFGGRARSLVHHPDTNMDKVAWVVF